VLLENSRERLTRYCRQLAMYRQPGRKIGAIVMNANPSPSATAGWWSRRPVNATGYTCLW
jgi:citrate lyase synthetase